MTYDDGATAKIVEQLERSGLEKITRDGARPVNYMHYLL